MPKTETPTEATDRIVQSWLEAEYSNVHTLFKKLRGENRELLLCALTTVAGHGVSVGMSGNVKHLS